MEWLETIENGRRLRVYVRPGTDDARFVYEASGNADYQDARAFLSAGAVVIDVGGHIGAFALCAAANGARVITIKPVPDNFHRLTENIAANAMQSQVKAIRAALWSAAGERVMRVADDSTAGNGFWYDKASALQITVLTLRLDELMIAESIARCGLLKLDCEGAEFEILSTLTADTWERLGVIVLEYQLWAGYTLAQLHDLWRAHGFWAATRPSADPAYGFVLALRPADALTILPLLTPTEADSPLTRAPIVGSLWRAVRRPAHQFVVYYLNQLIAEQNCQQRRVHVYMRLLAQRLKE